MKKLIVAGVLCILVFFWGLIAFFAVDEPEILLSTDINEYMPITELGAENFEELLRISRLKLDYEDIRKLPDNRKWEDLEADPEAYRAYILSKKDIILQNYQSLEPFLVSVRQIASDGEITDTAENFSSDIVKFALMRQAIWTLCQYTELTHFDETLVADSDDLISFLRLHADLIANSRTLVNVMISIVLMKAGYETMERILPNLVEEQMRLWQAQIASPLDAVGATLNSLYCEYCMFSVEMENMHRDGLDAMPFMFHENRTLNTYGRFLEQTADFAARRDWVGFTKYSDDFAKEIHSVVNLKNYAGRSLISMAIPAFSKVFETADELDQKRVKLLDMLNQRLEDESP